MKEEEALELQEDAAEIHENPLPETDDELSDLETIPDELPLDAPVDISDAAEIPVTEEELPVTEEDAAPAADDFSAEQIDNPVADPVTEFQQVQRQPVPQQTAAYQQPVYPSSYPTQQPYYQQPYYQQPTYYQQQRYYQQQPYGQQMPPYAGSQQQVHLPPNAAAYAQQQNAYRQPNLPPNAYAYQNRSAQNASPYPQQQMMYRQPVNPPQNAAPAEPVQKPKAPPLTKSQKRIAWLLRLGVLLLAAIFVYCIVSDVMNYRSGSSTAGTEASATKERVLIYQNSKPETADASKGKTDENGQYTVAGVAETVSPSIVAIECTNEKKTIGSVGSGIILSEDGYILTNAHVIEGCEIYTVTLTEQEEKPYDAELIGYDSKSDLAILKIDAKKLTPAVMGNSDELSVGEAVVAIGSPAGLSGTVTDGIVSALHRQIRVDRTSFYMDCIQTNAAISPGNSGGALVNMYGQVVGITSSKYASIYSGNSYEGLGFAITINQALPIVDELVAQGYVSGRVRMGITFTALEIPEIAQEFAKVYKVSDPDKLKGLWITDISEECDIANTDLQVNDIILRINGKSVNNYDELSDIINDLTPEDEVKADCRRYKEDGTFENFQITFHLMADTSGDY